MVTSAPSVIRLKQRSRYQVTPVYSSTGDVAGIPARRPFFGTWERPRIRETRETIRYTVRVEEVGNPHLIAHRVYGDKTLWWAFCIRNAVRFPLVELTAGRVLVCPHVDDVLASLL